MSTTDDQGPVKATVIDLDPDQVIDADAPKPTQTATETAKPLSTRRLVLPLAVALLAGFGLGGWAYRDLLSSYLPSNQVTTLQDTVASLDKARSDAEAKAKSLEALTQKLGTDVSALQNRLQELEPKQAALEQNLIAEAQRLSALDEAQTKLATELKALASAPSPVSGEAAALVPPDLLARLETVEKDLAALKAGISAKPDTTALSQSLSDLKAKVEAGIAFKSEYDRLAQFVPAAAGLETLGQYAELGLPDAKGLATELAALTPTLPKPESATQADAEQGWFESLGEVLGSVITIRESGVVDWQALAAQAQVFADAGDLAQAISTVDAAEGAKPVALQQWRDRAAQRLLLEQALAETSQSVTRELAARQ
jgi:hypothetical protein